MLCFERLAILLLQGRKFGPQGLRFSLLANNWATILGADRANGAGLMQLRTHLRVLL
jgi:hypothetical protein